MSIRAVVFDVGGVLEVTLDLGVAARWESRLGLDAGEFDERLAEVWTAGGLGALTEQQVTRAVGDRLAIDEAAAGSLVEDMWAQYLGAANSELIEYARGLRPAYRTGILSNSFVGAREREQAAYGFEDLVDEIVYSHEVGMAKPDPRIYALTCARLRVRPGEVVFVDDKEAAVTAARDAGIHAVRFANNAQAIGRIEALREFAS